MTGHSFFPENACAFLQLEVQVGSLRFLDEYAGRSEHFKLEGHAGRPEEFTFLVPYIRIDSYKCKFFRASGIYIYIYIYISFKFHIYIYIYIIFIRIHISSLKY